MVARINTVAFSGIEVLDVDVQVQVASGLPTFTVVGLPDKAVTEARKRVRAALAAIGLALPPKRITVNLSPADLAKEGSHFDLPIALALLAAMDVLPEGSLNGWTALGELALDGAITPVAGVLPAAIHASARQSFSRGGDGNDAGGDPGNDDKTDGGTGTGGLICPAAQGPEAVWAGGDHILAAASLLSLINHFKGTQVISPVAAASLPPVPNSAPDMADIKGQEHAKRVLEIAAAGGHNLLMVGPPGAGKSMLAARLPGILPPLDASEALEASMIHSLAGALGDGGLVRQRPFRDPHHSASMAALTGGGHRAKPGEVSLAHLGVLFLDELPEFQRGVLDSLRQPIETGRVSVARANAHVTYPARVQLIAAMNPCRCGHLGDAAEACSKAPRCGDDYQSKISGPLFDRIDLHLDVPAVRPADLHLPAAAEPSADVAARVQAARDLQKERYRRLAETAEHATPGGPVIRTNAEADGQILEAVAAPDDAGRTLLMEAAEKMKLTARGYHRVLRVARTLADLDGGGDVKRTHIAEALSYRRIRPGRGAALAG